EGRRVLLTFGLIGPGKGIEVAIRAMPRIVAKHPDVIYFVLGATHPNLLRSEGNAYRTSLQRLVEQLKLDEHVVFHDRYVSTEELLRYLSVADVYVMPYPNVMQITSGTLAYAVGAGKPVVSTPFWHAEELLADGRGVLFPFGDSEALADRVCQLLENDTERHAIRKRAYLYSRPMIWPEVAKSYLRLASEVLAERRRRPRPLAAFRADALDVTSTPDADLRHMLRLTDDTGILQHAIYATPDRHHGYCSDDNARALIVALQQFELTRDTAVLPPADIYLAFLHHAFNREVRRFRNFLSYDRHWLEDAGSEDCHGRCLWALGTAVQLAPSDAILAMATRLFLESIEPAGQFRSPRAWAFSLIGLHRYLQRFSGDTRARRMRQTLAERLMNLFAANATDRWPWCEDSVTYANAKLPHALILSGRAMEEPQMLQQGVKSLTWLVQQQITETGRVSIIGNQGWLTRDGIRARFDQQPIEAMALVEACAEAYRATGEQVWFDRTRQIFSWFVGNNDTQTSLYDPQTGGCCDGLHAGGPNHNQGAEATVSWLLSVQAVIDMNRSHALRDSERAASAIQP
ncbi:MAG: glycosyltransferase, partial [Phycisphaerae bacterium]|nr:glycosyltransferase [Phycisphaerae bacterium]